ncbi:uncharacterized protein LOC118485118 [Helianthus annuus]|uniref:uncharacterized protein LOC118485118 n=1 Tax=Helianthus annuus TaxID=4232 RepID=UPI001652FBFC|nr:uncharacterized protein LOC118485118 [Helianthus annuus]
MSKHGEGRWNAIEESGRSTEGGDDWRRGRLEGVVRMSSRRRVAEETVAETEGQRWWSAAVIRWAEICRYGMVTRNCRGFFVLSDCRRSLNTRTSDWYVKLSNYKVIFVFLDSSGVCISYIDRMLNS